MSASIYMCGPGGARKICDVPSPEQALHHVIRFLAMGHYSRVRNPGPGIFVGKRPGMPPDVFFVYDPAIMEREEYGYSTGPIALTSGPHS